MELKISKIQWKKVLAFILILCMTITMVQIPVNAEETSDEGGESIPSSECRKFRVL